MSQDAPNVVYYGLSQGGTTKMSHNLTNIVEIFFQQFDMKIYQKLHKAKGMCRGGPMLSIMGSPRALSTKMSRNLKR